jgi:serine/threonine protein kinase
MPIQARRVVIAQTKQSPKPKPVPERWTGEILDLKCIGRGISAMVFAINDEKVIKVGFGSDQSIADIETERRAFNILEKATNRPPHILRCFELDNPRGLVLERCHETLRRRLRSMSKDAFPSDAEARRWAKQAAEGLAFIHRHDIIHADVGCHNMLLTSSNELKLCDFGGSSVNGSLASTKYEVWSRPPLKEDNAPTNLSDLFALGSAIYEMSTKEEPYRGRSLEEIPILYQRGKFPSMRKIASLGNIIMNCWLQKYTTALDIVREIDPQHSLCCRVQKSPAKDFASSPENDLTTKPAANPTSSASEALQNPARSPISSANTSFSSTSSSTSSRNVTNKLGQIQSTKRLSIKGTTTHIHDKKCSVEHKNDGQTISKTASNKNNGKLMRKKTRHHSHLFQWMDKSFQPNGSHGRSI